MTFQRYKTPCQAVVDFVANEVGGGEKYWYVRVASPKLPDRRQYTITAWTDGDAAREAIRRYQDEMEGVFAKHVINGHAGLIK